MQLLKALWALAGAALCCFVVLLIHAQFPKAGNGPRLPASSACRRQCRRAQPAPGATADPPRPELPVGRWRGGGAAASVPLAPPETGPSPRLPDPSPAPHGSLAAAPARSARPSVDGTRAPCWRVGAGAGPRRREPRGGRGRGLGVQGTWAPERPAPHQVCAPVLLVPARTQGPRILSRNLVKVSALVVALWKLGGLGGPGAVCPGPKPERTACMVGWALLETC